MPTAIVVGGGIMGSSAAYRLALGGWTVALVDRQHLGTATAAGAGIVAPGTAHTTPDSWYPIAFRAVAYYSDLLQALEDDGESETGYETVGELVVAISESEKERLGDLRRLIMERREAGVRNIGDVALLEPGDVRKLFPPIHPAASALFVPEAARVDGRLITACLQRAVEKRGGKVIHGEGALVCEGGVVRGVRVNDEIHSADAVVAAAGAWTTALLQPHGVTIGVYPQRGQILHLDMPGDSTDRWPCVTGFESHYMLAFPGSRVVAGATREDSAGFDFRVTAAGVHQLISEAIQLAPGLDRGTVVEIRVGFRPASPDKVPLLGPVPDLQGLFVATGLGSSGLMMGPFAGSLVADLVLGKPVPFSMDPYDPLRFSAAN
jgi:D-amino-acid dehydrogenase